MEPKKAKPGDLRQQKAKKPSDHRGNQSELKIHT
jgi:hypothetical protein